jgi:hypothetical protein
MSLLATTTAVIIVYSNHNTCIADANCLSASLSWAWDNAPDEPVGRGSKSVTHLTYSVLKLVLQALPHFTRSFQILSHHLPLPAASVPSAIFLEIFSRHFSFPHSSSMKLFECAQSKTKITAHHKQATCTIQLLS